jgi:hypothetical protein
MEWYTSLLQAGPIEPGTNDQANKFMRNYPLIKTDVEVWSIISCYLLLLLPKFPLIPGQLFGVAPVTGNQLTVSCENICRNAQIPTGVATTV